MVLDSTSALNNDTVEQQARWLETVLRDNPNRWTVVTYHHPMFSVSAGRDNPPLRDHWKPLFDRYGVDLVLQGHDHVYGRAGDNLPEGKTRFDDEIGTMYVVSVGGPKMYMVSDQARTNMTRVAEDTQLYQLVRVQHDRILFEARTPSGRLYDSFELVKAADGRNRLFEVLPSERRCTRPDIPGYRETRCWEGSDLIEPPAALRNAR
ncbi:metallophosphoesterase [Alkalilimnicola ehrlichii]|uniref:metallophosphoesterase family protein n=1 Tax=Alkalilimnicola ehrlichii TaxID=351052 RepID=UPI0015F287F5|nr:metallophosphoesterase [Alkalilimnicola ehrlichii]